MNPLSVLVLKVSHTWIGTALQTASQNVHMFIGARFVIGFGTTLATNAAPLLTLEIAYPPYRAQLTALYNTLWYSGSIVSSMLSPLYCISEAYRAPEVAAWSTYGTFKIQNSWSWRIPSVLQGVPSIIQVSYESHVLSPSPL